MDWAVLKGTTIGSGSIVGAMALVAGKTIGSNTSYGGNPAKKLADNVFFTRDVVHTYMKKDTKKIMDGQGCCCLI